MRSCSFARPSSRWNLTSASWTGRGWLIAELAPGNDPLPYVLQVPAEYARDLADVLDEIITEQRDFDAAMDEAESRAAVWKRRLLIAFIGVVGVLAAMRYIDL